MNREHSDSPFGECRDGVNKSNARGCSAPFTKLGINAGSL